MAHIGSGKGRFKREGQHSSDDELWIISYADMMTLLFGFFVILYSFSTLDEAKFEVLTKEISQSFNRDESHSKLENPQELSSTERQARAFQMLATLLKISDNPELAAEQIENAVGEAKEQEAFQAVASQRLGGIPLQVSEKADGTGSEPAMLEMILPETLVFKSGTSDISSETDLTLKRIAEKIRTMPGIFDVEIIGHTDGKRPGASSAVKSNFTLSSIRAGVIAETLIKYGLDEHRITIRGMGSLKPLVPEKDLRGNILSDNMALNRRVHIVLRKRQESHGK